MGNGDLDADKCMEKMLATKVGRGLFPSTSSCIGASEHLQELGKNCASFLRETGKSLRQAMGFFLVGGLPTWFASKTLNTTEDEIGYFRKQPKQAAMNSLHRNYTQGINKQAFTEEEETVMKTFFWRRHP